MKRTLFHNISWNPSFKITKGNKKKSQKEKEMDQPPRNKKNLKEKKKFNYFLLSKK